MKKKDSMMKTLEKSNLIYFSLGIVFGMLLTMLATMMAFHQSGISTYY